MKQVLGGVGCLLGIGKTKATTFRPVKTGKKGKIEIEFLSLLAGNVNPFLIQHQVPNRAFFTAMATTMILEAPFIIYWDGWDGSRKGCPIGNVEINLVDIGVERHLVKNLDKDKLTDWIISHLAAIPDRKRVHKYVVDEMAWETRLSLETIKLLQKDG